MLTWRDERGVEYKSGLRGQLQKHRPAVIDFAAPPAGSRTIDVASNTLTTCVPIAVPNVRSTCDMPLSSLVRSAGATSGVRALSEAIPPSAGSSLTTLSGACSTAAGEGLPPDFEPGWRWSECIKPVVHTDACQNSHVGYAVSGRMTVAAKDGSFESPPLAMRR